MHWKRSSLVILAGATVLASSLLNAPPCENADLTLDQPPITANRLQAKPAALPESNFATVAYQDNGRDANDQIGDAFFNGLRRSPDIDEATRLGSETPVVPPGNQGSVFDRGREYQNPTWQANPLFDPSMDENESANDSISPLPEFPVDTKQVEPSDQIKNELTDPMTEQSPQPSSEHPRDQSFDQAATDSIAFFSDNSFGGGQDQSDLVKSPTLDTPDQSVRAVSSNQIGATRGYVPEGVAYRAALRVEYGKSLSRRGAAFAARQEFLYALNLIAQALDAQGADNYHTNALNNAVITLGEVEDFFKGSSESQIGMNVANVVDKHSCQVVSPEEARTLSRSLVVQRYLAYAENQFAIAGGQHVVASEAFYSLGKLRTVMSDHSRNPDQLDIAKAIMFHRDALACDANNFRSAHELGAVLANNGQLEEAKEMIKYSLKVKQTPEAWANLATIHERLGELEFAKLAKQEFAINIQRTEDLIPGVNDWLSPQQFNSGVPMDVYEATARKPETPTTPSSNVGEDEKPPTLINKIKSWF